MTATRRTGRRSRKENFQAERKEQQGHPDFRQQLDVVDLDDRGADGMRSHHHPGQDVADQQRLPKALCQETSQQSGDHNKNNVSGYTHKRRLSHAPANWVARTGEWAGGGTGTFTPLGEQQR